MDRKKRTEWGSDIIRTRISREPYVLEKRSWTDLKFWEWIFIIFALLSIFVSIGFSTYHLVLAIIYTNKFVFPVLVILNNIFSAYFLWNGVMEELPFKLLIQLVIKVLVWVFDLIYFLLPNGGPDADATEKESAKEVRDIRFYISSGMLFLTLTSGAFVIYQYWKSNVAIFRIVGTEPKYVELCRKWNFCHSMIMFDAVAFVSVLFHLWNFPYFSNNHSTYYIVPLCLIAGFGYVVLGIKAIEKESRMLTYAFYVASHFQPIFIVFILAKSEWSSLGFLLYISLFVTSLVSFLARIVLLISVVILQNSYGMGLKQAAAREEERKQLMTTIATDTLSNRNGELQTDGKGGNGSRHQLPPPTETEL